MSAKLFVISAPSGSGKTTLCRKLLRSGLGLANSISMTTRPPRPGEIDGRDYHFVSEKYFRSAIKKNGLLEYEENFGHFYGTPRKFIDSCIKENKSVLLSIDVRGAMKVARAYPGDTVLIFIMPPSLGILRKRLCSRKSDARKAISVRLRLARKEISYKKRYDYTIVNDRLTVAYKRLKTIVASELRRG